MKRRIIKGGCLLIAVLLLLLSYRFSRSIEKSKLLETEGRNFEKAQVIQIIKDNETENGNYIGSQKVMLKILTGEYKGVEVEADSSSSYLYGTHCTAGQRVIVILSESQGELVASVYSADREPAIWLMVAVFVLIVIGIGGRKGISSIAGLLFTMLCIFFLFLPLIYKGVSPIFAAIFVVAVTTVVTMIFIDGISKKTICAMLGTIFGVVVAGMFAWIFGKVAGIGGYNVSDVENLIYVEEMTKMKVGELLFAGILIAALGAVMDVAMSIASTLNELIANKPDMTCSSLFCSGMNVGRDMMGTMSNTLILAFTGGSINTLVFIYAYDYSYLQIINMYSIGIELMQGLSASMGVIITVPFTSLAAAWLLTCKQKKTEKLSVYCGKIK